MVVEQVFRVQWLERRPLFAFLIGFSFSFVAFFSALVLFPSYFGVMSISFISLLLVPTLSRMLAVEEKQDLRRKKFSFVQLFKDHYDIIEVYISLFLGVFLAYFFLVLVMPSVAGEVIFSPQFSVAGFSGYAFNPSLFLDVLSNNLIVLAVAFVLSLVYGAGAILFLVWNASVWGVVIGASLRRTIGLDVASLSVNLVKILPYLIPEALGYVFVAIAGGILSKAVIREDYKSKRFRCVLYDALWFGLLSVIFIVIAALIESLF